MAAASMAKNLRHGPPPSSYDHKAATNDDADEIVGYVDPWIVSPGDDAEIKVSSTKTKLKYQLIRLLPSIEMEHAPKPLREVVTCVPSGTLVGRPQRAYPGSFARVDAWTERPLFGKADGLEFSFYMQPWMLDAQHPQAILSTLDVEAKAGICILLTSTGGLELWVAIGSTITKVECLAVKARRQRWMHVRVRVIGSGVTITARHLVENLEQAPPAVEENFTLPAAADLWSHCPLMFAASLASSAVSAAPRPTNFFNGRLDSPTIKAIGDLTWTIASYDFSKEISSDNIVDISGNGLDGVLVNSPARAVKGFDFGWELLGVPWMHASHGYGAIHFHEDDLDDADWETDFRLTIPEDLRSGAYAVEVCDPDSNLKDNMVFFVRPKAVRAQARVAFVFPTFTYLAYANERMYDETKPTHMSFPEGVQLVASANFERMVRRDDLGLSHYDIHSDGSTVVYSSSKRPILNVRPDYVHWGFQRPREFASDLFMVGLLEELLGDGYDVLTDHDLHLQGVHALASYDLVISGSHPEYPSMESLNAYEGFSRLGKYLMYMGGNGFYWRTVTDRKRPHRMECRKADVGARTVENSAGERFHSLDGGSLGGLWRSVGRPPNVLFGVGSNASGKGRGQPFQPIKEALEDPEFAWVWRDLDPASRKRFGTEGLGGCASGDEIDRMDFEIGTPANAVLLAQSEPHDDHFMLFNEELVFPMIGTLGSQSKLVRSDMTYFDTASGGAVFSVGSINWNNSMAWDGYKNDTAQITRNVINEFLRRAASRH